MHIRYRSLIAAAAIFAVSAAPAANYPSPTFLNLVVNGTTAMTGALTAGAAAFSGTTTVPTVATGDSSTKAASTALVAAKIAAQIANVPQVTVYLTGSGTYTTPVGATYLEVEGCGGGSGGAGGGTLATGGAGGAGGATTFGSALLTANGGPATPASGTGTPSTAATATGGDINQPGGIGASNALDSTGNEALPGPKGSDSKFGNGGQGATAYWTGAANQIAATAATGNCSGGGGGIITSAAATTGNMGWGGNSGAYFSKIITSPAATYAYAVGAAGTAGTAGTSGTVGGAGAIGLIRVTAKFQ